MFVRARQSVRWIACCLCWSVGLSLVNIAGSETGATPEASPTQFECVIEPQQIVRLASPVVGVIARLDVDRGDIVRQNQIVGKLQDGIEAAALALARARATNEYVSKSIEARLQFLRSKYKRLSEL